MPSFTKLTSISCWHRWDRTCLWYASWSTRHHVCREWSNPKWQFGSLARKKNESKTRILLRPSCISSVLIVSTTVICNLARPGYMCLGRVFGNCIDEELFGVPVKEWRKIYKSGRIALGTYEMRHARSRIRLRWRSIATLRWLPASTSSTVVANSLSLVL